MTARPRPAQDADRVALVTGANRGIGRAIAAGLAALGMTVVLGARRPEDAAAAAAALRSQGFNARWVKLDVASPDDGDAAVREILASCSRLDVLVNNAGVYLDDGIGALALEPELLEQTFAVNLFGPFRLIRAAAPAMARNSYGRIVNLSSGYGASDAMVADGSAYRLSKLALNGMTRVFADALKGTGILVNAMSPGWVRSDMGGPKAPRSLDQGADTALYLATLPPEGASGRFFRDRREIPW